jgi:release factor glutamine methyltransferase
MNRKTRDWTVLSMLEWATGYFEKNKIPNPRLSIEWLLAYVLEIKRLDLYLKFDRPLTESELSTLRPLVKRRAEHEPLQYITGSTDFMGCKIDVNENVLIPRIETEQLVEELLLNTEHLKDQPLDLLDIGTGSGCIPISIKNRNSPWNCFGCDSSNAALETARKNATQNNVDITFFHCEIFNADRMPEDQKWHIIISNPPYIEPSEKSSLEQQVSGYEPDSALFLSDPISIYNRIASYAAKTLLDDGCLFLECNDKLASEIQSEVEKFSFKTVLKKDLDKNPRFLVARKQI